MRSWKSMTTESNNKNTKWWESRCELEFYRPKNRSNNDMKPINSNEGKIAGNGHENSDRLCCFTLTVQSHLSGANRQPFWRMIQYIIIIIIDLYVFRKMIGKPELLLFFHYLKGIKSKSAINLVASTVDRYLTFPVWLGVISAGIISWISESMKN